MEDAADEQPTSASAPLPLCKRLLSASGQSDEGEAKSQRLDVDTHGEGPPRSLSRVANSIGPGPVVAVDDERDQSSQIEDMAGKQDNTTEVKATEQDRTNEVEALDATHIVSRDDTEVSEYSGKNIAMTVPSSNVPEKAATNNLSQNRADSNSSKNATQADDDQLIGPADGPSDDGGLAGVAAGTKGSSGADADSPTTVDSPLSQMSEVPSDNGAGEGRADDEFPTLDPGPDQSAVVHQDAPEKQAQEDSQTKDAQKDAQGTRAQEDAQTQKDAQEKQAQKDAHDRQAKDAKVKQAKDAKEKADPGSTRRSKRDRTKASTGSGAGSGGSQRKKHTRPKARKSGKKRDNDDADADDMDVDKADKPKVAAELEPFEGGLGIEFDPSLRESQLDDPLFPGFGICDNSYWQNRTKVSSSFINSLHSLTLP